MSDQGHMLTALFGGLEPGDSEDFTEQEAVDAIPTENSNDFVRKLMSHVKGTRVCKFSVQRYAVRRFEDHLYIRVHLTATSEADKMLVFRADWVNT